MLNNNINWNYTQILFFSLTCPSSWRRIRLVQSRKVPQEFIKLSPPIFNKPRPYWPRDSLKEEGLENVWANDMFSICQSLEHFRELSDLQVDFDLKLNECQNNIIDIYWI